MPCLKCLILTIVRIDEKKNCSVGSHSNINLTALQKFCWLALRVVSTNLQYYTPVYIRIIHVIPDVTAYDCYHYALFHANKNENVH